MFLLMFQRVDDSGTCVRGEIHMLLVGDPGKFVVLLLFYLGVIALQYIAGQIICPNHTSPGQTSWRKNCVLLIFTSMAKSWYLQYDFM